MMISQKYMRHEQIMMYNDDFTEVHALRTDNDDFKEVHALLTDNDV